MEEETYNCEICNSNDTCLDHVDTLDIEKIDENSLSNDKIISEIINMNENFLKDITTNINNKNMIIYLHLPFSLLDGGVTVQYYLAKLLDSMDINVKICNVYDNNKKNPLFNKFITLNEIKEQVDFENTVVIYCEGIIGNPLNAKYVVRWFLSRVGQNVPLDYLNTWSDNELVYFFNSDNTLEDFEHAKYLSLFFIHPYIQNFNKKRSGVCFTRRKNIYPTKDIHSKNSFEITREHTQKHYIKIFNKHKFFISYDPLTFLSIIAALCGCISIVYPIEGVTKKDYFKKTAFYDYMKENNVDYLYGIAYGNTLTEINYARKTMHLLKDQLEDIQLWFIEKYIKNFIYDINHWENNKNNLDNYKDNFVNYLRNNEILDIDLDFYKSYHKDLFYLNTRQLVLHYLSWGKKEGRVTSQKQLQEVEASSDVPNFDLEFYRTYYNDLSLLHGIKLIQHYKEWGKKEGRATSQKQLNEMVASTGVPDFDLKFYKTYHNDLSHLYERELIRHYKEWGKKEGRIINQRQLDELFSYTGEFGSDIKIQINKNKLNELIASLEEPEFNIKFYRTYYSDLKKLNLEKLIQHYKVCGKKEGRVISQKQLDKLIASTGEPDFDVNFYKSYYKDLSVFFERELIRHYKEWGKREGRIINQRQLDELIASTGEPDFDVEFYRTYYSDLSHLFEYKLIEHYNNYGKKEGRITNKKQFCIKKLMEIFDDDGKNNLNEFIYYHDFNNFINNIITSSNKDVDFKSLFNIFKEKSELINNNFFKWDFKIDEKYNYDLTESTLNDHQFSQLVYNHEHIRRISNYHDLLEYFNKFKKKYVVYDRKSFYKYYNDFDYQYYKDRYFKDSSITEDEILNYYHTKGKYQKHIINNKIKIVIYVAPFDVKCGGITVIHYFAYLINTFYNDKFYAKLFMHNNLRYDNSFCNDFAQLDEINDNTIAIYPEIIYGNPLNAKNVVRWILLDLGIEMPLDHYKNWGFNDLVYYWESNKCSDLLYKQLTCPLLLKIFNNNNHKGRYKSCYLVKKGRLIHQKINNMHPINSICIDNLSLQEINIVFNQCKYFYCYDANTAYIIYAAICGCVPIIYPIENINEEDYFKSRIYNFNGKIFNKGIVYSLDWNKINYILENKLNENNKEYYQNLFDLYQINTIPYFLKDINLSVNQNLLLDNNVKKIFN